MKRPCQLCKDSFDEGELHISHDIPKYLGGVDSDGRHLLCKECHEKYERTIFISVASYLKNISPVRKEKLRMIASKTREDFFNETTE